MLENLGSASYWHETSRRDPNPALAGHVEVDVAVIGGGYTGLWTAYHLLEAEPTMKVAVLEQSVIGFGASGRNGGFAMTLLDMSLDQLRNNYGDHDARAAHEAVATSVAEIGQVIESRGIDCEWRHGGLMTVATNKGQMTRLEKDFAAAEAMGLDGFRSLTAEEAQAEVHSPTYLGGLHEDHCGVLHPAKLVRGLADVVESMGASVYEGSEVTGIDEVSGKIRIRCGSGTLVADQAVLATNAWASRTEWFSKKVVPLYTYIIATEPLTDEQWESVGWNSHCGIEDKRNFVHYYRRTADGRITWGGSDGVVYARPKIASRHDTNRRVREHLMTTFRRTFPQLSRVRFTHHWGGPVGITVNFLPVFGTLSDPRLHYGLGYNGHGVAPSHTGGKILRDKVLGVDSDLTKLCFVDSKEPVFPPEPLTWIGAELTRRSMLRQDAQFDQNRGSGDMDPLLLRIMRKIG